MYTIVSSTNRAGALSLQIAKYYAEQFEKRGIESQVLSLADLPHDFVYSALYDNNGKNEVFNIERDKLTNSEKLIFIIPEYNGSFPGILKAFMDGMGYPQGVRGKKAALCGISSGMMGSALAMSHFTDILNYLGCSVYADKPRITAIDKSFKEGAFQESLYSDLVDEQIDAFVKF